MSINPLLELTSLPNIGKKLSEELNTIGIKNYDDLLNLGSLEIAHQLKNAGIDCCCNKLYAIEGAIQNIRWHEIPKAEREELKNNFSDTLKN